MSFADQWMRILSRYRSKDLSARGETEQRRYMISAWGEAPHL
jgi:hypothetical protein